MTIGDTFSNFVIRLKCPLLLDCVLKWQAESSLIPFCLFCHPDYSQLHVILSPQSQVDLERRSPSNL